ncbi:MAG: hypothetical protein KAR35_08100 [Candidatus Heimdallarchaeota archaeon]|nr:hypothetical protein [Candidatus Heimdallarchaeota archaeon]MCK5049321.1 hypothetical protein [Candidatus Heimdallarchaeota archaeon]
MSKSKRIKLVDDDDTDIIESLKERPSGAPALSILLSKDRVLSDQLLGLSIEEATIVKLKVSLDEARTSRFRWMLLTYLLLGSIILFAFINWTLIFD